MSKTSKTILIIDDNPYILKPLSLLLSSLGYSVTSVSNGKNVTMAQIPFTNLILLDSRLQSIRGEDICKKIKQNKTTQHIPIIMCSADNRIKIIAKEAGADDYIEKPFSMADLLKKIEKYI